MVYSLFLGCQLYAAMQQAVLPEPGVQKRIATLRTDAVMKHDGAREEDLELVCLCH